VRHPTTRDGKIGTADIAIVLRTAYSPTDTDEEVESLLYLLEKH